MTSFGHRDAHEGGNSGDRSRFTLFLVPGTKIAHGLAAAKFSVNDLDKMKIKFEIRNKLTSFRHHDAHESGNLGDRSLAPCF